MRPHYPQFILVLGLSTSLLTACSFAPKYERPAMPIPAHYKEAGKWIAVKSPVTFSSQNVPWWELYHDETLNELERKVTCSNENLKIALARFEQACAIAQVARSAYYPTVIGIANATKQQNPIPNLAGSVTDVRTTNFLIGPTFSYEIDAWGKIRNTVMASNRNEQASAFDLAAVSLSLHAELANDYFALRGDDAAQRVLDATVTAYKKAYYLTRQRHDGGAAPEIDVDQAKTQVENAKTLATEMRLQRAQLEHAIAVLTGEIPANFKLPSRKYAIKLVTLAPEFPSTLLERRPDVAAAEQRVEAANATIGVARAAFFPDFNFFAVVEMQGNQLSKLFNASSLFWALGTPVGLSLIQPLATEVLFDGYKLRALLKKAKASYFEAASNYRQTSLTAFREVEDNLVAIRRLDQEIQTQTASSIAAKRALYQANRRYRGGIATYLNVIVNENEALQSELALVNLQTRRQLASVQLIKALGGGWVLPKKQGKK